MEALVHTTEGELKPKAFTPIVNMKVRRTQKGPHSSVAPGTLGTITMTGYSAGLVWVLWETQWGPTSHYYQKETVNKYVEEVG